MAVERETNLVIGRERNWPAIAAKHGSGIAAVGDDDLIRRDDGDDRRRSHGVALRRLELAPASGCQTAVVPRDHLLVHAREASLHRASPLRRRIFAFELFLHQLMQAFSAFRRHLKTRRTNQYIISKSEQSAFFKTEKRRNRT